jgi:hypothetical protein
MSFQPYARQHAHTLDKAMLPSPLLQPSKRFFTNLSPIFFVTLISPILEDDQARLQE